MDTPRRGNRTDRLRPFGEKPGEALEETEEGRVEQALSSKPMIFRKSLLMLREKKKKKKVDFLFSRGVLQTRGS